jgi:hypothetical protein
MHSVIEDPESFGLDEVEEARKDVQDLFVAITPDDAVVKPSPRTALPVREPMESEMAEQQAVPRIAALAPSEVNESQEIEGKAPNTLYAYLFGDPVKNERLKAERLAEKQVKRQHKLELKARKLDAKVRYLDAIGDPERARRLEAKARLFEEKAHEYEHKTPPDTNVDKS